MKLSELTKNHQIICRSENEWERIAKLLHEAGRRWQSSDPYWPLLYRWQGIPMSYCLNGTYAECETVVGHVVIESTEIVNSDQKVTAHQTFGVGDKCWSPVYGYGEVIDLSSLVTVEFRGDCGITWRWHYQPDGREYPESPQPTLFHQEVKEWPCPVKLPLTPDLKVDDKVYVESNGVWVTAHFSHWLVEANKIAMGVFSEGKTSHTTNGDIWFYTDWKIAD